LTSQKQNIINLNFFALTHRFFLWSLKVRRKPTPFATNTIIAMAAFQAKDKLFAAAQR
jgi:hypothetical protein